jgi:xylan 1,4-beta-xylosidase
MLKVVQDIGFTGVRFHGVLDDDMSVYQAPKNAAFGRGGALPNAEPEYSMYSFYNSDQVYDFLLSAGVAPIVELSYMPCQLVAGGGENCTSAYRQRNHAGGYKGCLCPPADFNDWYKLVKAFAGHLVGRYGLETVSTWRFEVWNEPRGTNAKPGMDFPVSYMALYNASAVALKGISPRLQIGGPATMCLQNVPEFIEQCHAHSPPLPIDFISTHVYPTDGPCVEWDGGGSNSSAISKNASQLGGDPDQFAHAILNRQKLAAAEGVPFLLTEYNDGHGVMSRQKRLSDTSYAAAFLLRNIPRLRALDAFSWWTFTDM